VVVEGKMPCWSFRELASLQFVRRPAGLPPWHEPPSELVGPCPRKRPGSLLEGQAKRGDDGKYRSEIGLSSRGIPTPLVVDSALVASKKERRVSIFAIHFQSPADATPSMSR
jgi:hypothetical protein